MNTNIDELKIVNLKKAYHKKDILKGIDLTAQRGQCIGLLGANGSGKSTLLSILAGVLEKDEGEFYWQGKPCRKGSSFPREEIAYVPQELPLFEELSALDNLLLWYDKKKLLEQLDIGILNELGIKDFLSLLVKKMSGGMKKRLSIGCAVAGHPSVLLLDEPSAALDLEGKEFIRGFIKHFLEGGGIVLLATHDTDEIALCDILYILKGGKLIPYHYDGDLPLLVRSLS